MAGGTSAPKKATPEIQELVNKIKAVVEQKEGVNFAMFEAVQYKTQVVAGTNCFVKIKTGPTQYIHCRIFKGFNDIVSLSDYQIGKTLESNLSYF
ncbi:cystatin-A-like [Discoglossus pictus]